MVKIERTQAFLIALVVFAAFLRFADLSNNPPGLYADEALTGYDAYSLSQTGRDLWDERLPVFFRSWGDYNSGLYRYMSVPFVATFGLSTFSTRAAAALIGTLTVLLAFLLGRRLCSPRAGLIAAALVAISPWHLQFSRIAFRGILLPFFLALGTLAFFKALERGRPWLIAAFGLFGLTLYTYSPARLIVPLYLIFLLIWRRREIWKDKFGLGIAVSLLILISLPMLAITSSGEGQLRYATISILDDGNAASLFARNYLTHFSPNFLLVSGDVNLRHSPDGFGQLNWAEFLLLIAGVVLALRRRGPYLPFLALLILAPIPDSLTKDNVPNALRSIAFIPSIPILAGTVLAWMLSHRPDAETRHRLFRNRMRRVFATVLIVLGVTGSFLHLEYYFTDYKSEAAPWWDYGYKEAIHYCEIEMEGSASAVIVTPSAEHLERYAINPLASSFLMFYMRSSPEQFQRTQRIDRWSVVPPPTSGHLTDEMLRAEVFYVLRPEMAESLHKIHVVEYPSGEPALVIARKK